MHIPIYRQVRHIQPTVIYMYVEPAASRSASDAPDSTINIVVDIILLLNPIAVQIAHQ